MKKLFELAAIVTAISVFNACAMEGRKDLKLTQQELAQREAWQQRPAAHQASLEKEEIDKEGRTHPVARRNLLSEFDQAVGREDMDIH